MHLKSKNNRTIYTAGTFDLFHFGHLNILRKAKEMGDKLIVGVSSDDLVKKYKFHYPIITFKERMEIIKELKCVDQVIEQNSFFNIKQLGPLGIDLIVLGNDWENKEFPELYHCLKELNIGMRFIQYTNHLSTTKIKKMIVETYIMGA